METRGVERSIESMAIAGDRRAIDAVWATNRRWIAAVIAAHSPRYCDLDDLIGETALLIVRRISSVRHPDQLRAWMRMIAINVVRTEVRNRARRSQSGREEIQTAAELQLHAGPDSSEPVQRMDGEDSMTRLERLIQEIPVEYREPLLLRAVHGLRTRQIAAILDVAPPTVDTRIARARKMLRDLMEAQDAADRGESPPVAGAIHRNAPSSDGAAQNTNDSVFNRGTQP